MQDNNLFFFTHEYPYGNSEVYIENELKVLAEKFDTVFVFPLRTKGTPRKLPSGNIKIIQLFENNITVHLKVLLDNLNVFTNIIFNEFKNTPNKIMFLKMLPELKSRLLQNIYRAKVLEQYLQSTNSFNGYYYSFWTEEWATVLSILKQRHFIKGFISRVHGYDLYKERWPNEIIPFRYFQLKNVSRIFAVSKGGLMYMQENYPLYHQKFSLSHLNVFDEGTNPWSETTVFTIISCSNLIPLKRLHLVLEALKNITVKMNWIIFGDGELRTSLEEQAKLLPSNITCEFRGSVKNEELMAFYRTQPVHLFIHMSETEGGVPLALQEAASFGIPLMGANAGGISEIVSEKTGVLTEKNITAPVLSGLILKFKDSEKNSLHFRQQVKRHWQLAFDAKVNYESLYNKIINSVND